MTFFSWDLTAADNNDADATINWRESQAPSTVNNSARAMMAALAKYRDDMAGIITTGGSSTAYTATSNQGYTANGDGHTITLEMHATNGVDPTLNVDARGALAILTATGGAAPASGALLIGSIQRFTDNGTAWIVNSAITPAPTFVDSTFSITDNGDATKVLAFQCSGITTATTRTLTVPDASGTIMLTSAIGVTVQAFDADILKADLTDTLTVGFNATEFDAGTKSSGTYTPDPASGNFQKAVNGGAHTLAPPGSTCTIVIQYTNNGSAGAVTTSGFTKVTGSFTTTNGHDFLCFISRINGFSFLSIVALQ
jgi:hypothetical protein